jgi:hypothetical protein
VFGGLSWSGAEERQIVSNVSRQRERGSARFGPWKANVWLGLAGVVLLVTLGHAWLQFEAVDSCLDQGGVYDYAAERCMCARSSAPDPACDSLVSAPVIPYMQRHGVLFRAGIMLTAALLAGALMTARRHRRT